MKIKITLRQRVSETIKQKSKIALAAAMGGFAIFTFIIFFTYNNAGISKTAVAAPGKDWTKTISASNIILNEYTSLTSDVAAGVNNITVANAYLNSNGRFASNLSSGDLVMIIQMQGAGITTTNNSSLDALISYNNAGNFEFAEVSNVSSATKIIFKSGISKSYTSAGKVQVIRVPRYSSLNITANGSVTAPAWDGSSGGIVAIEVNQNTILNGSVNMDGKGFSGDEGKDRIQDYFTEKIFMGIGGCELIDTIGTGEVNGGGIVYLISGGTVSGTGTVSANSANSVTGVSGGGGTVVIYSKSTISGITINVNGGRGDHQNFTGGNRGYISISNSSGVAKMGEKKSNENANGFGGIIGPAPTFPYSSGATLPVELIRFNGTVKENKVGITWATAAEISNDYFTIEKSTDGINFRAYVRIEGAGNTTTVQDYNYVDINPSEGMNYYRLRQTDFNGKTEYFKIIAIDFRTAAGDEFEIKEIRPKSV